MQNNCEDSLWSSSGWLIVLIAILGTLLACPMVHAWENNYQYQLEMQRQQTDFQNQQWQLQQQQNIQYEQRRQQQQAEDALNRQYRQMGPNHY